jgi:hypothetical protein
VAQCSYQVALIQSTRSIVVRGEGHTHRENGLLL